MDGASSESLRDTMIRPAAARAHHSHTGARDESSAAWTAVAIADDDDGDSTPAPARRRPRSAVVSSLAAACSAVLTLLSRCCSGGEIIRINARRLRVVRRIGEGGYSYVLLAEDCSTRALYAVKRMLSHTGEARARVRLEIEQQRALSSGSALGATRICPIVDYSLERLPASTGDAGGPLERAHVLLPYFARGSVQTGIEAKFDVSRGAAYTGFIIDAATCLAYTRDAAAALARVHASGLAHRDVCPRNLMISPDGRHACLIDFGSCTTARVEIGTRLDARRVAEQAAEQSTMPFRAPELWDPPTGATITEACDVYSLGATAYAMAYGLSPGESRWQVDAHTAAHVLRYAASSHTHTLAPLVFPPEPAGVQPDVSAARSGVRALCMSMCALDAAARPRAYDVYSRACGLLGEAPRSEVEVTGRGPEPQAAGEDWAPFPAAAHMAQDGGQAAVHV